MKRRCLDLLVLLAFLYQQGACCCGSVASHAWVVVCAAAASTLLGDTASAAEPLEEACSCHDCGRPAGPRPQEEASAALHGCDPAEDPHGRCVDSHGPSHAHHICLGFHLFALAICPLALLERLKRGWSAFWGVLATLACGGRLLSASGLAPFAASLLCGARRYAPRPSQAALQVFRF